MYKPHIFFNMHRILTIHIGSSKSAIHIAIGCNDIHECKTPVRKDIYLFSQHVNTVALASHARVCVFRSQIYECGCSFA